MALVSNHLLWTTHWFILSVGWLTPLLLARFLGIGVEHETLHLLARALLTACLVP